MVREKAWEVKIVQRECNQKPNQKQPLNHKLHLLGVGQLIKMETNDV